jgi:uncharacterized protein YgiM (DUF1202 family)
MIDTTKTLSLLFVILASATCPAESVYVTDQLQIGLHADKTLSSPIVKIVSSGTPLELIKTEDELSFVREPDGTGGWIDNSYISPTSSANVLLRDAQIRIKTLEESLATLQRNPSDLGLINPALTNDEVNLLQQQLQEERFRSSDLQTQLEGLGRQMGQMENVDSLYEKIEQLSVNNNQLKSELTNLIENTPPVRMQTNTSNPSSDWINAKNILISISVLLVIGILIGIYIMDFINRRRHGGFRV